MEQTTNEFLKAFRERFKYPILTIYTIILIIHNWDILGIYFISTQPIETRIKTINTDYSGQTWERIFCALLWAIAISIIAPFIMWGLDETLKFVNGKRQLIKDEKLKASWKLKKEIAHDEYEYDEARSGSKKIKDWENNIKEIHRTQDIINNQHQIQKEASDKLIEEKDQYVAKLLLDIGKYDSAISTYVREVSDLKEALRKTEMMLDIVEKESKQFIKVTDENRIEVYVDKNEIENFFDRITAKYAGITRSDILKILNLFNNSKIPNQHVFNDYFITILQNKKIFLSSKMLNDAFGDFIKSKMIYLKNSKFEITIIGKATIENYHENN